MPRFASALVNEALICLHKVHLLTKGYSPSKRMPMWLPRPTLPSPPPPASADI